MRFFVDIPGETISMNLGRSGALRTYSNVDADDAYRAYGDACELGLYADAHARGVRRADPRAHAHVDDVRHECERANEGSLRDRGCVRGAPKREATPQDPSVHRQHQAGE